MKKLVLVGAVGLGLLFSGCAVDTLYLTGEAVGEKVLPKDVKEKIKPYNEAIKDGYGVYTRGNVKAVATEVVTKP